MPSCSSCGYSPCTCNNPIYSYNWLNITNYPCDPCSTTRICKIKLPGECVFYNGPNLTCLNLTTGINYDLIISTINTTLCSLQTPACQNIFIPALANLPEATVTSAEYFFQLYITGTQPITLSSIVKPSWLNISISGNIITFIGTPVAGTSPVSFTATNACSTANFSSSITAVANSNNCVNINTPTQPPIFNLTVGNQFFYQVVVAGSVPITTSNIIKPAWLNIEMIGNAITLYGTAVAGNSAISIDLTNACSTDTFVTEINVA